MSKLKKNIAFNTLYEVIIIIIPFITMPYVARKLGTEGVGEYTYIFSITSILSMFCILGVKNYGLREIFIVRKNKIDCSKRFSQIWSIQLISSFIVIILYLIFIIFNIYNYENNLLLYIQLIYLISNAVDISWLYRAFEDYKSLILKNIIIKIVSLILIFIFIENSSHVNRYAIIMLSGYLISNLLLFVNIKKYVFMGNIFKDLSAKDVKGILLLFVPVLSITLYQMMDKVMLGYMTDNTEVAVYEYATKIVGIPISLIGAFSIVLLPRVMNINNNKTKMLHISLLYTVALGSSSMFGLMAISNQASIIFFGYEFSKTGEIIFILSLKIIIVSYSEIIRIFYILPQKKDNIYVLATIFGVISNLVLNVIFIPKFNSIGASFATIISELISLLIQSIFIFKIVNFFVYIIKSFIIIIPSALMYVILLIYNKLFTNINAFLLILEIVIGIICYFIFLLPYVIVERKYLKNVKNDFKKTCNSVI